MWLEMSTPMAEPWLGEVTLTYSMTKTYDEYEDVPDAKTAVKRAWADWDERMRDLWQVAEDTKVEVWKEIPNG